MLFQKDSNKNVELKVDSSPSFLLATSISNRLFSVGQYEFLNNKKPLSNIKHMFKSPIIFQTDSNKNVELEVDSPPYFSLGYQYF
jgi:hypothetical protein